MEDVQTGVPAEGVPGQAASQPGLPEQHPVSPGKEDLKDTILGHIYGKLNLSLFLKLFVTVNYPCKDKFVSG